MPRSCTWFLRFFDAARDACTFPEDVAAMEAWAHVVGAPPIPADAHAIIICKRARQSLQYWMWLSSYLGVGPSLLPTHKGPGVESQEPLAACGPSQLKYCEYSREELFPVSTNHIFKRFLPQLLELEAMGDCLLV